jgi:hypothetical protein
MGQEQLQGSLLVKDHRATSICPDLHAEFLVLRLDSDDVLFKIRGQINLGDCAFLTG